MTDPLCIVGIWPCGCCLAVVTDERYAKDKDTRMDIADWVSRGASIERKPLEWVCENLGHKCPECIAKRKRLIEQERTLYGDTR
jgi:hypothetical protein